MVSKRTTITKSDIYAEVHKATAYEEEKLGDDSVKERIATIAEDEEVLDRFWEETKTTLCLALRRVLDSESETSGTYTVNLNLSGSFDETLWPTMEGDIKTFFVKNIAAKWFAMTYKDKEAEYTTEAASFLENALRKAYFCKKPTRPTY